MEKIEFSFAEGGALLSRWRKLGILRRHRLSPSIRAAWLVSITWLPLLILTTTRGLAFPGRVQVPYLLDWVQHARFLVALPIAVLAEGFVSQKYEGILDRFLETHLVSGEEVPHYRRAIARARALKDSVIAETCLIVIAYLYLSLGLQRSPSSDLPTWIETRNHISSLPERWYLWVSMPIFLFVWLRWIWRQLIWGLLLFRISRLKLRLVGTHPDRAGGLAFVAVGHRRFAALFFAISAIVSASIGEEIVFGGAKFYTFEPELLAFFLLSATVVLGPLIVFSPPMIQAKLRDWGNYGLMAAIYTQGFDDKWIQGRQPSPEAILGSSDIQSLSDLKNSYEGISQMRSFLPDRQTIMILLFAYLLPLSPLLITVIPLRQILSGIFQLLLK